MFNLVTKSSAEWEKELADDVKIIDPVGWRKGRHGLEWHQQIPLDEFEDRLAQSVIIAPRGLYFLWKDKEKNGK